MLDTKRLQEVRDQYDKDPIKFLEEFYNIKLYPYQKILLKMVYKAKWKGRFKC